MYPPLCLPAAIDEDEEAEENSGETANEVSSVVENRAAEDLFSSEELDIMYRPKKYRIRFAIWDAIMHNSDK